MKINSCDIITCGEHTVVVDREAKKIKLRDYSEALNEPLSPDDDPSTNAYIDSILKMRHDKLKIHNTENNISYGKFNYK